MTTMTMTVTRALAELKFLDDRINRAIMTGTFIGISIGRDDSKKTNTGASVDEATKVITASHQRVESLIANREKIKRAIIRSNSETKVKIVDQEITVAEAIELKKSVVYRESYINAMRNAVHAARINVNAGNTALDTAINQSVNTVYGNDKGKVDAAMYDAVAVPQKKQKEHALLDPCKVDELIEKQSEIVDSIKKELDFILSESNAKTNITIDLTAI